MTVLFLFNIIEYSKWMESGQLAKPSKTDFELLP